MSDEITSSDSINLSKGEIKNRGMKNNGTKIDQTGAGYVSAEIDLSVTPVALDMGDLTTPGRYGMKCTVGATGNAQVGSMDSGAFVAFDELPVGESSSGRLATTAPYARITLGTGKLEYFIAEA